MKQRRIPTLLRTTALACLACGTTLAATPPELAHSTIVGGAETETLAAIARDASGNVWLAGTTSSTNLLGHGLITDGGPGGAQDAFVAKFDPTGQTLLGLAILGGSGMDRIRGLACAADSVWLVGETESEDFPLPNSPRPRKPGLEAWVARIDLSATQLLLATTLGGANDDAATGCARDAAGNLWVTGWTESPDFPVAQPFSSPGSGRDAFAARVAPDGTIVSSTRFGGSGADQAHAITLGNNGDILIAGGTESDDFPVRQPSQAQRAGPSDGFALRISQDGATLVYATYIGGGGGDELQGIMSTPTGSTWVCGQTTSSDLFPAGSAGAADAFVLELNAGGSRTGSGGRLGGTGSESATCVAVDAQGAVWVAGWTSSSDLPGMHALQPVFAGGARDVLLARLQPVTSQWDFVTTLGASDADDASALLPGGDHINVVGSLGSQARGQPFPTTAGAYQNTFQGGLSDGFWCKVLAQGTAAANDAISTAAELSGARLSTLGTLASATAEPGEPAHAGVTPRHSLWWIWRAPTSGPAVLSTEGSPGDTVLSVYRGSRRWDEVIGENNDDPAGGLTSRVVFTAEAGAIYTIAIDGDGVSDGRVVLSLSLGQAPNDDFKRAEAIGQFPATVTADITLATGEPGELPHGEASPEHSVWWTWTAPADMDVMFDLGGSTVEGRLFMSIYTGNELQSLLRVTSDNTGNRRSAVLAAKQGTRYVIAVDCTPPGRGTVRLALNPTQRIANDDFASRIDLSAVPLPFTTTVDLRLATRESAEDTFSGSAGTTAWWSFTPAATGNFELTARGTDVYSSLVIYTGSALGSLTRMLVNTGDPMAAPMESRLTFRGVAGQTCLIVLDSYYYGSPGLVTLRFDRVETPSNDDFEQRSALTGTQGNIAGTLVHASHPADDPWGYIDVIGTVWYEWQSPSDGNVSFSLRGGLDRYGSVQIFTPAIDVPMSYVTGFRYAYAAENCGYPCIVQEAGVQVRAGQRLFVEVGGATGATAPFELGWRLFPTIANDNFEQPTMLAGAECALAGVNTGASIQMREAQNVMRGANGGHSLWWQWTAPTAGLVEVSIQDTGLRVMLDVYTGDVLESLERVVSNGLGIYGPPYTNKVTFPTAAGTTYRICLDSDGPTGLVSALLVDRPALHFDSVKLGQAGAIQLEIGGSTDREFRVETSSDLRTWTSLTTLRLQDHRATCTDPAATAERRFYRAVELP